MNVSPILTTRIDKGHPKDHIIGDLTSAIQTRRMTKISDEHAMIEAMQEELLQFQLQKVWTLVDLPNGKRDIGTKWTTQEEGFSVQMDVKCAFLYGYSLKRKVYFGVANLPGFEDPHFPDKVYKRRGTIDKTLFIKKDKGDILLVQVYVDEIIFGSTKKSLCDEFEVHQKEDGIFISQDKYVAEILKKFDFAIVKTTSTPIETNKALVKDG
ncbi:hypothetical protein Tco_0833115 [Tanacetum coccineum]